MITAISVLKTKLNDKEKRAKPYIVIRNQNGVLLVDEELFVISFESNDEFAKRHEFKQRQTMLFLDIKKE